MFFSSHTRAKIKQLKTSLHNTKKGSMRITQYLLTIKALVDALGSIGSPMSTAEHLDAIFDGLPEEYDGFITSVTSRLDPYTVSDVEALLLAQEACLDKHLKIASDVSSSLTSNLQANVVQFPPLQSSSGRGWGRFGGRSLSTKGYHGQSSQFQCGHPNPWGHSNKRGQFGPLVPHRVKFMAAAAILL